MCLYEAEKLQVPEGGKKCYKFLIHYNDDADGIYHSPYYENTIWTVGCQRSSDTFYDMEERERLKSEKCLPDINKCAYHAYLHEEDAWYTGASFYICNLKDGKSKFTVHIVECTIPEDTEYFFIGHALDNTFCHASEKLIFNRVIATIDDANQCIKVLCKDVIGKDENKEDTV